MKIKPTLWHLGAILLTVAIVAAACGGSDDDSTDTQPPTEEAADGEPTEANDEPAATDEPQATNVPAATDVPTVELIGCESNIGPSVPVFYSTYFRCTDISLEGDVVVISGLGLPPHLSYYYGEGSSQFEVFDFSRGGDYRPNRNEIALAGFTLRIPLDPVAAGIAINANTVNLTTGDGTDYPMGAAGVALDGVALFNPLARPGDDIEAEKFTFDSNNGHPQQQGTYHYHAVSTGSLSVLQSLGFTTTNVPGLAEIELYGVMCDGTVVMGSNELDASATAGNLDLQAGHTHDIVDSDGAVLLADRYHIHMAPSIGANPRGLTPEAQYYSTCNIVFS